jgi:hypothetical protein
MLAADLMAPTQLVADSPSDGWPPGDLHRLWRSQPEAHKWLHYFPIYEEILTPIRLKPIKLLEIGVYRGASLRMWRDFFPNATSVVGLDIDPATAQYTDESRGIHCRIGSQFERSFLRSVVQEFGRFDVIIDDGSHRSSHMIASFNDLFLDGLSSPGLYIAEDVHCGYWRTHRDARDSFMDLCKVLMDLIHAKYEPCHEEMQYRLNHPHRLASLDVPRVTTALQEIRIFDSIVVLRKNENKFLPVSVHS